MPCNIGYSEQLTARLSIPKPQAFRAGARAPRADRELLERIGVEDPAFVAWFRELDVAPLLTLALDKTRQQTDTRGLRLAIDAQGRLTVEADYRNAAERAQLAGRSDQVLARWQFEVLAVIA